MKIYILVAIWFAGIATAGIALLLEDYSSYVVMGASGWTTVVASSGLIFYEIKRIRAEDRKKELA
jgi:FtsH-binding integral membrane protein